MNTYYIKKYIFIFTLITFVLGSFAGWIAHTILHRFESRTIRETRLKESYQFINPLLECDTNISNFKPVSAITTKVENYLDTHSSTLNINDIAVYYRDLNNGPWFGINENTLFTPASLTKVPLMMTYYKKAERDPDLLKKKLKINKELLVTSPQTYNSAPSKLIIGKSYTIDTLIRYMIIYSDNYAYLVLKSNLSEDEFNKIFKDFGINVATFKKNKTGNVLSIKDFSSFFRILYNSSYLNREYSEKSLKLLSEVEFKKGLVAGIPNEKIAHKFGERYYQDSDEKQLHDCGIVYLKSNPYLICIMTRGSSFEQLSEVIKDISAIIHADIKAKLL